MGFIIGKMHDDLSSSTKVFETIGQQLQFDSFETSSRAINKTRNSYKWREKLIASMDMDFLSEADYWRLRGIIMDRSSIRPGFAYYPIPESENVGIALYDMDGMANPSSIHIAKYFTGAEGIDTYNPLTTPGSIEIATANYTNIGTYDTNVLTVSNVGNGTWFTFNFDISDYVNNYDINAIRRLTLLVSGAKSSPIKLLAWDFLNEQWYEMREFNFIDTDQFSDPTFNLNAQMAAGLSLPYGYPSLNNYFISSNRCIFAAYCTNTDNVTYPNNHIQYVRLMVNGYYVNITGREDLNYRDPFTGAGRRGGISLEEV